MTKTQKMSQTFFTQAIAYVDFYDKIIYETLEQQPECKHIRRNSTFF